MVSVSVEDAENLDWNATTDVVAVGSGARGYGAALSAVSRLPRPAARERGHHRAFDVARGPGRGGAARGLLERQGASSRRHGHDRDDATGGGEAGRLAQTRSSRRRYRDRRWWPGDR